MKTVKFLMIALIAAFTVTLANAQTSPKAPVKKVATTKVEKAAQKTETKVDTAKKEAHKSAKKHKKA